MLPRPASGECWVLLLVLGLAVALSLALTLELALAVLKEAGCCRSCRPLLLLLLQDEVGAYDLTQFLFAHLVQPLNLLMGQATLLRLVELVLLRWVVEVPLLRGPWNHAVCNIDVDVDIAVIDEHCLILRAGSLAPVGHDVVRRMLRLLDYYWRLLQRGRLVRAGPLLRLLSLLMGSLRVPSLLLGALDSFVVGFDGAPAQVLDA